MNTIQKKRLGIGLLFLGLLVSLLAGYFAINHFNTLNKSSTTLNSTLKNDNDYDYDYDDDDDGGGHVDKMVGLVNYANTCFANSTFQILYHCSDFRRGLRKFLKIGNYSDRGHFEVAKALDGIFMEMDLAEPESFIKRPKTADALPIHLRPDAQFDPSEVLGYYLLFKEFDWSPFIVQENPSQILFLKTGGTRSIEDKSNKILIPILFLDINSKSTSNSIQSLIKDRYSPSERGLSDIEIREKKIFKAVRVLTITGLPENLILQLNRFYVDINGTECKYSGKIKANDIIDFKAHVHSSKNIITTYKLVGFILHVGKTPNSGHYITFFKKSDGTWFEINDTICQQISISDLQEQADLSYIYLYKKTKVDLKAKST